MENFYGFNRLDIGKEVQVYKHEHYKTEFLYNPKDTNYFLYLIFPIIPYSNNGVAHVLEHCILNRSKIYEEEDVFNELRRRCFPKIQNATTHSDRITFYMSASSAEEMSTSLEALLNIVFYPELSDDIFASECFERSANSIKPGVVLNEVSGYYADPRIFATKYAVQSLYSKTPYQYDSGGDPEELTTLSNRNVCDFHKDYFTRERLVIYTSGSMLNLSVVFSLLNNFLEKAPSSALMRDEYWSLSKTRNLKSVFAKTHPTISEGLYFFLNWRLDRICSINDLIIYKSFFEHTFIHIFESSDVWDEFKDDFRLVKIVPSIDVDLIYPTLHLGFFSKTLLSYATVQKVVSCVSSFLHQLPEIIDFSQSYNNYQSIYVARTQQNLRNCIKNAIEITRVYLNSENVESATLLSIECYSQKLKSFFPQLNPTQSCDSIFFMSSPRCEYKLPNNTFTQKLLPDFIPSGFTKGLNSFTDKVHKNFFYSYKESVTDTISIAAFLPVQIDQDELFYLRVFSDLFEIFIGKNCVSSPFNLSSRAEAYINDSDQCTIGLVLRINTIQEGFMELLCNILDVFTSIPSLIQYFTRDYLSTKIEEFRGDIILNGTRHALRRAMSSNSMVGVVDDALYGFDFCDNLIEARSRFDLYYGNLHKFLMKVSHILLKPYIAIVADVRNIYESEKLFLEKFLGFYKKNTQSSIAISSIKNHADIIRTSMGFASIIQESFPYGSVDFFSLNLLTHIINEQILWKTVRKKYGAYSAFCSNFGREKCFTLSTHMDPDPLKTIQFLKDTITDIHKIEVSENDFLFYKNKLIHLENQITNTDDLLNKKIHHMAMGISRELYDNYLLIIQNLNLSDVRNLQKYFLSNPKDLSASIICSQEYMGLHQDHCFYLKDWTSRLYRDL